MSLKDTEFDARLIKLLGEFYEYWYKYRHHSTAANAVIHRHPTLQDFLEWLRARAKGE